MLASTMQFSRFGRRPSLVLAYRCRYENDDGGSRGKAPKERIARAFRTQQRVAAPHLQPHPRSTPASRQY